MPNEQGYSGVILKKTAYAEADEIITIFTKEAGKLRVLAKSVKRASSKLQHALQPLFLLDITVVGRETLPKVIHAQTKRVFKNISFDPRRVGLWFVVAELLQKSLADAQKHEGLFELVVKYLEFLDRHVPEDADDLLLELSLTAFQISFMREIGLAVHYPSGDDVPPWFSAMHGGFHAGDRMIDSQAVTPADWGLFQQLLHWDMEDGLRALLYQSPDTEVRIMISGFVSYQLEREIKSERFLEQ